MIKKILFSFIATITLFAGLGLTASAQETAASFDYRTYADTYPDLKAAYGYDANALFTHYVNFGKAEGRVGNFAGNTSAPTANPAISAFSLNTISVGGNTYTLPCPVSEFLKNGWTIDYSYPNDLTTRFAGRGNESSCMLRKGNEIFSTQTISPYLDKDVAPEQGLICGYSTLGSDNPFPPSLIVGGGITINSTRADVEAILPNTFEKTTFDTILFSSFEPGSANRFEPVTKYSNYNSVRVQNIEDFEFGVYFNERQNTVRCLECTWIDREYEASLKW